MKLHEITVIFTILNQITIQTVHLHLTILPQVTPGCHISTISFWCRGLWSVPCLFCCLYQWQSSPWCDVVYL